MLWVCASIMTYVLSISLRLQLRKNNNETSSHTLILQNISYGECILILSDGTTAWVRIPVCACGKVASDLGLEGGFAGDAWFPSPDSTGWSRLSRNMAELVTKNRNSKFQIR